VFAVSGFAVTFRDALGRHQAEELAILKDIAAAGRAAAARNTGSTISQLADAVQRSASLAMSVKGEQTS
jgi:hypothetical protein